MSDIVDGGDIPSGGNMGLSPSLFGSSGEYWKDVVRNSELLKRPCQVPDYEAENKALAALARTLADAPEKIFQRLAETALRLCRADSAGISLLKQQDGVEVLRREAVAGIFSERLAATIPRYASPCGVTIDRNATQLLYRAQRVFPAMISEPRVIEALVIPFHAGDDPIGTVWVFTHDERRKFDRQDERIIKTLAQFASVSRQLSQARATAEDAGEKEHRRSSGSTPAAASTHLDNRRIADGQPQQRDRESQVRVAGEAAPDLAMLAAAIAHDFNNILNVIQAHAGLIARHATDRENVAGRAEVIIKNVEEGAALAQQLFALGQKTPPNLDLADVNNLLQRMTESLTPMLPATIVMAADLDPRVPLIMMDAGLIQRAILNLYLNARDAMPAGGRICLQTRTASGAVLRQRFPDAVAEHFVCISIADTGVGMAPGVRSRIFESYFTTKKPSQGTGLGLSIVHSIVSQHAGFMDVVSEPGQGSTFCVYLPIPEGRSAQTIETFHGRKIGGGGL